MSNKWEESRSDFDRNLAVIIGIDRYESHPLIHNLSTPVNDAIALADLLEKKYGYQPENVRRLINEQATLTGLQTLLNDTLPKQLKPTKSDRLIFYFAGHGLPKNSDKGPSGYLVSQDAELGQENSFLPMSEVYDALEKLQCHHLLVILDCCFAGTFRWASSRKLIAILETIHREHYDHFIRHPAWQVITSSAHDQEALDFVKLSKDRRGNQNNEKHSPFALALLEALQDGEPDEKGRRYQNADYTKDGVITAHELFLYISDRVSKLSKDRQVPGLYPLQREYDKGEFIFIQPGFDPKQLSHAPELNEENNPYRGLKSFEERHANLFFGRQKLVEELSDRLTKSSCPLTVVLGTSGSGKSSLVKAGLLPYLRQKQEKEKSTQRWYLLNPMRPGKAPFTELARAALPVANSNLITKLAQVSFLDKTFAKIFDPKSKQESKAFSQKLTSSGDRSLDETRLAERWYKATLEAKLLLVIDYCEQLKSFCHQPQEEAQLTSFYEEVKNSLDALIQTLQQKPQSFNDLMTTWSQANPNTKLLLVIDQFEELITMSQDDRVNEKQSDFQGQDEQKEWQRFLFLLRIALAKYRRQLHVIVTLRSDFEPRFLNSALKVHWKNARFPVRAMNTDELRDAIEGPALKQALYFEPPELVGKLIDEVGQMPGALPLLSFTLSELYIKLYQRWTKDRSTDRALRIKDYEELGEVAGALTRRATEEYDNFIKDFGEESGKAYQATMKRVMLRMVAIEGGEVARRRVPESELVYSSREEDDRVATVIECLVNTRLLVKGQETGEPYVEPAHDFLVRGWDKLQSWLKEEQGNLILQKELIPVANKWAKAKRERKSLGLLWDDDPRLSSAMALMWKNDDKNRDNWLNFFQWILGHKFYKPPSNSFWLNFVESNFIEHSFEQKFKKLRNAVGIIAGVIVSLSVLTAVAFIQAKEAIEARNSTQQELSSVRALRQFEVDQNLAPLISAMQIAQELNQWRKANHNPPLQMYRTISPIFTLQKILDSIYEQNEFLASEDDAIWQLLSQETHEQNRIQEQKGKFSIESADHQFVAVRNDFNGVVFKDSSGTEIGKFTPRAAFYVKDVKFSHDSQFIAVMQRLDGGEETEILSILQISREGRTPLLLAEITGPRYLGEIAFTSDDQYLVTGNPNPVRFWQLQPKLKLKIDERPTVAELEPFIYTQTSNGKIQCLDENGQQIAELEGEEAWFQQVLLSPDKQQIASLSEDGKIRLWNLSEKRFKELDGHQGKVERIVFSMDGQYLATVGNIGITIVLTSSGSKIGEIEGSQNQFLSISFSPDKQRIATIGLERTVRLWDLRGRQLAELSLTNPQISQIKGSSLDMGDGFIPTVKFTSDGKHLAIFSSGESLNPTMFWKVENLDNLLKRGCQWLSFYLKSPSASESDKQLCLNILGNL